MYLQRNIMYIITTQNHMTLLIPLLLLKSWYTAIKFITTVITTIIALKAYKYNIIKILLLKIKYSWVKTSPE